MVITIYNHKGGTGKTTTTLNLGAALCRKDRRILLIDLDPQANLTFAVGAECKTEMFPLLYENILEIEEHLYLLPRPNSVDFAENGLFKHIFHLSGELEKVVSDFDDILIDCPPAKSLDVANGIIASDYIIIPSLLDVMSIEGLRQAINSIDRLVESNATATQIIGILPVMVNQKRNLSGEIISFVNNNYNTEIMESQISISVKLAEAPSFGQSIFNYAPKSKAAEEYMQLGNEIIKKTLQPIN